MQGDAPRSPLTNVPGWMTEDEENMLTRYASMLAPSAIIINIGCEYGRSLIALATIAPAATIYGIELTPLPELEANVKEASLKRLPTVFVADSKVVGREWNRGEIDLIFIDGAHEYENIKGDIEAWTPHVKSGGYVLFHDVAQVSNKQPHYLHFEVSRAMTEWLQSQSDFEAVGMVDTLAVFHRVAKTVTDVTEVTTFTSDEHPVSFDVSTPKEMEAGESVAVQPLDQPGKPKSKITKKAKSS